MTKKKDNLTDLLDRLPKDEDDGSEKPTGDQRVQTSDGEWVVLDYKPDKGSRQKTKLKSLELIIQKKVEETMNQQLGTEFVEQVVNKVIQKLKDKGLL